MLSLAEFRAMTTKEKKEWEIHHSTNFLRTQNTNYDQCRAFACESIVNGLTKIYVKKGEIVDIQKGVPFHFIGRVDTSNGNNSPQRYYQAFGSRNFVAYSTICNQNVSHYKGNIFFIYNIFPQEIVHIFPMDSDTKFINISKKV